MKKKKEIKRKKDIGLFSDKDNSLNRRDFIKNIGWGTFSMLPLFYAFSNLAPKEYQQVFGTKQKIKLQAVGVKILGRASLNTYNQLLRLRHTQLVLTKIRGMWGKVSVNATTARSVSLTNSKIGDTLVSILFNAEDNPKDNVGGLSYVFSGRDVQKAVLLSCLINYEKGMPSTFKYFVATDRGILSERTLKPYEVRSTISKVKGAVGMPSVETKVVLKCSSSLKEEYTRAYGIDRAHGDAYGDDFNDIFGVGGGSVPNVVAGCCCCCSCSCCWTSKTVK